MGAPHLQETSFADGIDSAVSALEHDGGVIVHDFIPQDVLAGFRADMHTAAQQRHYGSRSDSDLVQFFWGPQTMRFTRLATRSRAFLDIPNRPAGRALADERVIGQDASVEIACSDCGCVVDRGVVLVRCSNTQCCCRDLPDRESMP